MDIEGSNSVTQAPETEVPEVPEVPDSRSIAERRPRRIHVPPKRYDDTLPEPNSGFIPLDIEAPELPTEAPPIQSTSAPPAGLRSRIEAGTRKMFKSPRNIFGLSREYFGYSIPEHDPEQFITTNDFVDQPELVSLPSLELGPSFTVDFESTPSTADFHPYPNQNSFLLGNWYWCGGVQKSQQSFSNLVDILKDPSFNTSDIRDTNWAKINTTLAGPHKPLEELEAEWEDEESGWVKTPVSIGVPFSYRAKNPGPKNYTISGFYHRSLVSVIKEKLSNAKDNQYFHYEPFELRWHPKSGNLDGQVYGELYSSPEFIKVHNKLQEPRMGELECNLPKVVLALMFWSDTTHLTSFGKAHIWPLYMAFGNESKYRRCRPSLHLLNHVAYFEKVCVLFNG